jgi:hypothetical protein
MIFAYCLFSFYLGFGFLGAIVNQAEEGRVWGSCALTLLCGELGLIVCIYASLLPPL